MMIAKVKMLGDSELVMKVFMYINILILFEDSSLRDNCGS